MDSSGFKGLGEAIMVLIVVCAISVPLGLWKLIEIIVWVCRHMKIGWE